MSNLTRIVLCIGLLAVLISANKSYLGHKVLRFSEVDSYEKLQKLEKYDVWANLGDNKVDVHFSPAQLQEVDSIGLPYEVFMADVQESIEYEKIKMHEAS